jgi:hypothetical protein
MLKILNDWLDLQAIEPKDQTFLWNIQRFINENWSGEPLGVEQSKLQDKIKARVSTSVDQVVVYLWLL